MKKIKIFFIILASFLVWSLCLSAEVVIKKVIDGDTIKTADDTIRLIGVDCSEMLHPRKPIQYYAKESSDFVRKMVEGKAVRLEYESNIKEERLDKYGRLLAYVYLADNTFVNAEIVKQGYGFAYTKYPFKYSEAFKGFQVEAKTKGLGLWKNNGRDELSWIMKNGPEPYLLYQMTNDCWGIRYRNYFKARIENKDLLKVLEDLRYWVIEFADNDLDKKLKDNGWEKE